MLQIPISLLLIDQTYLPSHFNWNWKTHPRLPLEQRWLHLNPQHHLLQFHFVLHLPLFGLDHPRSLCSLEGVCVNQFAVEVAPSWTSFTILSLTRPSCRSLHPSYSRCLDLHDGCRDLHDGYISARYTREHTHITLGVCRSEGVGYTFTFWTDRWKNLTQRLLSRPSMRIPSFM